MDPTTAAAAIEEQGFTIIPGVLTETECDLLTCALGALEGRAGTRHLMHEPLVRALAHDPRLRSIAGDGVPFRATLFTKTSQANWLIPWHQDTALPLFEKFDEPDWGPWSRKAGVWYAHAPEWALRQIIALRVHLDASNSGNGPLRVIAGSHHKLLTDAEVEGATATAAATACLSGRGGVIAMRPLIVHASSKIVNDLPRRVLHIEYTPKLELREGVLLKTA